MSNYTLTDHENSLLTKGLKFIPTFELDNSFSLSIDKLIRSINTQYYFKDNNKPKPAFFTNKSSYRWLPPDPIHPEINNLNNSLEMYKYLPLPEIPLKLNINATEELALKNLINNKSIIIKPTDKGNGIAIMNTNDYIAKTFEHLSDTSLYCKMDKDYTPFVFDKIDSYLSYLKFSFQMDISILKHLAPPKPSRTPVLYCLPKTMKPNIPFRPIISACDSPSYNLSDYLTYILNPINQSIPSYLGSTKQCLQIIDKNPPLNRHVFLVTADV